MTQELFRFSTTVEVRWRDLDAMNHVNNAVYITYLEQGRVHYLRELRLIPDTPSGIGFILAEVSCQFKSPLKLGERVKVLIRACDLGRTSFGFEYRLEGEDGRLAAEARSTQVQYDYDNQRPVPLSAEWRRTIVDFEPALSPQTN